MEGRTAGMVEEEEGDRSEEEKERREREEELGRCSLDSRSLDGLTENNKISFHPEAIYNSYRLFLENDLSCSVMGSWSTHTMETILFCNLKKNRFINF